MDNICQNNTIYQYMLSGADLEINEVEALRYLGYKRMDVTDSDVELIKRLTEKVRGSLVPRAVYGRFPVSVIGDGEIHMPYGIINSKDLTVNLKGCSEIFIFAATIGAKFDMALNRARIVSIAEAAVFQALGATAVEELCDRLNEKLNDECAEKGEKAHVRYSPGFGDFGLENQKGVFSVLRPEKMIGLTLKDNLIMAPEKSVTAIIGIEK